MLEVPQVFGDGSGKVAHIYQIRLVQPGGHEIQFDHVMAGLSGDLRCKFGRHLFAAQMIDLDRDACLFGELLDLLFEFRIGRRDIIGSRQDIDLAFLRMNSRGMVQRQHSTQASTDTKGRTEKLTTSYCLSCNILFGVLDHD